jgi:suppressor for copper-sensitivity B
MEYFRAAGKAKIRNLTIKRLKLAFTWLAAPILAAVLTCAPLRAETSSGGWHRGEDAAARLIAGQSGMNAEGRIWLGVQIKLKPGWKTYWRNPGESGAPPRFDWSASLNLATADVRWPAPLRFSAYGFDSFGYQDEVVLPVLLRARAPGKATLARLKLDYMICAKVCVPMQADLSLELAAAGKVAKASAFAPLIRHYRDLIPQTAGKSGLSIDSATVSGPAGQQILHISGRSTRPFQAPDLMVEGPEPFGFGRPNATFGPGRHDIVLALPVFAGTSKAALTTQALTLTLVDGDRAVERRLEVGE